jgi:phosphatidate cytidylyltransferase
MVRRALTALILLAVLLPAVYFGGIPYFLLVTLFVGIAAWEYAGMFRRRGFRPAQGIAIPAVLLLLITRMYWPQASSVVLTIAILAAMAFHLWAYERGRDDAAIDLLITLGGITYLGWIAAYLLDLRLLPNGMGWLLLVLATVWIADSVAYFVGVRWGRHKMAVRLSPRKTWEGYAAGALAGTAIAGILGSLMNRYGYLELNALAGAAFGLVLSGLTTLGDLGESLFKRYAGIKDSGTFLPGHGGAFDRIDSLIWAGVLGYYFIRLFLI